MPKIWGKYAGQPVEEIDEFETLSEARRMLSEYRLAFGAGWTLWIGKKYPIPR